MEEIRRQDSKPHLVPINYMTSGVILLETQTTSALYTQNIYLEGLSENKGSRQPFVENGISHSTTAATGMPRRRPSGPFRGRGAPGSRRGAAPGLSPGPCRPPPSRRVARASRPPACPLAPEAARARSPQPSRNLAAPRSPCLPPRPASGAHGPRPTAPQRLVPHLSASPLLRAEETPAVRAPELCVRAPRGQRRRGRAARPPPPPRPRPGRRSPVAGGAPATTPGSAPLPGSRRAPAAASCREA